jgi:hypothetical protein
MGKEQHMEKDQSALPPDDNRMPPAPTGNASNPSPDAEPGPAPNQLIDEKGEKYLREVASIEDVPDPQEQADAERQAEEE